MKGVIYARYSYAQKWSHVKEKLLPGAVALAVVCVITGLLVMWIKKL